MEIGSKVKVMVEKSVLEKVIGIYAVRCKINSRVYIGQSKNIRQRCINHYSMLLNNKHYSKELQLDYNQYGRDSFECLVLEEVQSSLDERERHYISQYEGLLYNTQTGGKEKFTGQVGYWTGKHLTDETKKKLSEANKKYKPPVERVLQGAATRKASGYHHSEETKQKISQAKKGRSNGLLGTKRIKQI